MNYIRDKKGRFIKGSNKGGTISQIAKEKLSSRLIGHIVSSKTRRKISSTLRRYDIRETYFDRINTQEKAYILGLLYADGCIKRKRMIQLDLTDKEILLDIREILYANKKPPLKGREGKNKNYKTGYRLLICNYYMATKLIELGVLPKKTFKIRFPKWLKKELHPHFIRGYFDGDGSIYYACGTYGFNITGNKPLIKKIQKILAENCNFPLSKLVQRHKNRKNSNRSFVYAGRTRLKRIRDYLYKDATIYLKRKYDLFFSIDLEDRNCIICRKLFSPKTKSQITCLREECRKKNRKRWLEAHR